MIKFYDCTDKSAIVELLGDILTEDVERYLYAALYEGTITIDEVVGAFCMHVTDGFEAWKI